MMNWLFISDSPLVAVNCCYSINTNGQCAMNVLLAPLFIEEQALGEQELTPVWFHVPLVLFYLSQNFSEQLHRLVGVGLQLFTVKCGQKGGSLVGQPRLRTLGVRKLVEPYIPQLFH